VTSLQEQARALGDPTRHRIFRQVADADEPVAIADLVAANGINHNAVRQHLAKLVAAELLVESTAPPAGPGRPRLVYRLAPTADSRWGVTSPYQRLSRMLAEVIRTGETPEAVGRDEGRARAIAGGDVHDVAAQLAEVMARDGFDPEVRVAPGRIDVVLRRCPFADTAEADPITVCALHRGIARGLTEDVEQVEGVHLVARDPHEADCRLTFRLAGG
jgi:predicted ArsR family transcriptional regulator